MLLEREDSFMSEFEDACSAWVDSVGSNPSDGADSDVGSPFCQGECDIQCSCDRCVHAAAAASAHIDLLFGGC